MYIARRPGLDAEIQDLSRPCGIIIVMHARRQAGLTIADREATVRSGDHLKSRHAAKRNSGFVRSLLFGALAASLLLWVALYNGYPTVYPDTGSYIYTGAFRIAVPPFRSPGYSVFLELTSLGASAWFTIIAQAVAVVVVLYETCKFLIGGESRFRDHCLLAFVCVLAALTSLPWETSLLMPDIFAGLVFLTAFLLAFNARLRLAERFALAAILTVSVSTHASLLPIAAAFVATLLASALVVPKLTGSPLRGTHSAMSVFLWLIVPLIASGLWTASLNSKMGLGFKVSVSGNEFLLGRLFGDGLAGDYLRENCPTRQFVACRHLNTLPKTPEEFLFWNPLLPDLDGNEEEISQIVRGTLAAYPLRFAWISGKQTLRQLVTLRTGNEVRDYALNAPNSNAEVIQQVFPGDFHAFSTSRLIRGRLVPLTDAVAAIDTAVFWLSLIACIILARTHRREKLNGFFYSALIFLILNAAVCATFAGVYDRYQSRVAWIVPLCFASYVCCLVRNRKRANS